MTVINKEEVPALHHSTEVRTSIMLGTRLRTLSPITQEFVYPTYVLRLRTLSVHSVLWFSPNNIIIHQ